MDKLEEILKKVQDELASIVENIKSLFSKSKSGNVSEDSEGEEELIDTDEKTKPQNINTEELESSDKENDKARSGLFSNIQLNGDFLKKYGLRIFLIIAVALLFIDTVFLGDDNPAVVTSNEPKEKNIIKEVKNKKPSQIKDKVVKKKIDNSRPEINDNEKIEIDKSEEIAQKNSEEILIKNKVIDIPPETSTNVLSKNDADKVDNTEISDEMNVVDTGDSDATESTNVEKNEVETNEETGVSYDLETDKAPLDLGETSDTVNQEKELGSKIEDVISTSIEKEKEEEGSMYVSPPTYQRFGRGLVYNCTGKHWACVDHYSYIKCMENEKYNKEKKENAQCIVKNTYASNEDCIKVQTYYTNNNEKTDFCLGEQ